MTAPHSPFEQTVAITAAARNTTVDLARAELIVEALQWVTAHIYAREAQTEVSAMLGDVAGYVQGAAAHHHADAQRYAATNHDAEAANRAACDSIAAVAGAIHYATF